MLVMYVGPKIFALSVIEPDLGCEYRWEYDPSFFQEVPVEQVCGLERLLLPHNLVMTGVVIVLALVSWVFWKRNRSKIGKK